MSERRRFIALLKLAEERHIPLEVSVELTHRCNLRCQHCYIPDLARRDGVTTARFLSLFEELAEAGTLFLTLTGGEIFMRRDWLAIARRARELGFSLRLFSNGTLIDEQVADAIQELAAGVEVSLYSMDSATFEAITGVRGSHARTLRGIELLTERRVEVKLKVPVMTLNLGHETGVFAFAQEIGAECTADARMLPGKEGNLGPTRLQVPHEQLMPFYRGPQSGCEPPSQTLLKPSSNGALCAAGVRMANVTASGDVRACNVLPGVAGNINERPFGEIWETSPWFAELRSIRREDLAVCSTCHRFAYCKRCAAQAMVEGGDLRGPSPWSCAHAEAIERAFDED